MKIRWIVAGLLLSMALSAEMKCAPGKCGAAMESLVPEIKETENQVSEMKCAPGKCGSSMDDAKGVVSKEAESSMKCEAGKCGGSMEMKCAPGKCGGMESASTMQCAAGKCGSGMESGTETVEETERSASDYSKPTIRQLFNVTTSIVEKRTVAPQKTYYGYLTADESRTTEVTAWFSGYIETLYADTTYLKVNKGEALAKVYAPEVYKAKQEYLNSLNYHEKQRANEMVESARTKLVLMHVPEQEIKMIEAQRKVDRYTVIYAPASGWVMGKSVNAGSSFREMQKLFTIVNLDQLWVEAALYQKDLSQLAYLEHFKIHVKGIEGSFGAKRSLLYPVMSPKEATMTLRLSVDNRQGMLRPGMFASVHATLEGTELLVIPNTAVIRKNGQWYVFLATAFKGEYEPVQVEVMPLDATHYIVKSGLSAGERVVNNALFMMDSDAQINSIY